MVAIGGVGAVLVERALPHAEQRVEMPVLTLRLRALARDGHVLLRRLAQRFDLELRGMVVPEGLHEAHRLGRDRSDGLGTAVQEGLGHGRLVRALDAAVQAVVRGLEGHLQERIRADAHGRDERLAVTAKLERLELVLLDEVREARLGEAQRRRELGRHVPLELVRRGRHAAEARRVALGRVRAVGGPQGRGLAVDALGEAQDGVGVEVAGEAQHRVAVDARVLEVDAGAAVGAHDDLQLVVPAVRARTDLHAAHHLGAAAQHGTAQLGRRGRLGRVEAQHEERRVDRAQALGVDGAVLARQDVTQAGPDFAVLGAEHADGTFGSFGQGRLGGVVDDRPQVQREVLLSHDEVRTVIEHVEPVELAAAEHDDVLCPFVLADVAAVRGRHAGRAEQSGELVHT